MRDRKKVCMNPDCQKRFVPGHYGDKQRVCRSAVTIKCPRCKGSGRREGARCPKCRGEKKIRQTCREWYKHYWSATRKPPRGIPAADLQKILRAVKEDPLYQALLIVAAESGLRKGELLGLTWADVLDSDGAIKQVIEIRGQWDDREGFKSTKTDKGKLAFLLEQSRRALKALVRKERNNGERIWGYDEVYVWDRFVKIQKRLKIRNPDTGHPFRVHDLRHSAAIRALEATGDLTKAQVLLGHKSIATTSVYTQQRPEKFVADLEKAFRERNRSNSWAGDRRERK